MKLKERAARLIWDARRRLHLIPPLKVMKELKRRGVDLGSLHALEVFGGMGTMQTRYYEPNVKSLEVWEIEPGCEASLRKNLPRAVVRIVDSYKYLCVTESKFGLVIADSPLMVRPGLTETWTEIFGGHCEHFELFPDLFRILDNDAVLILNIMPEWKASKFKNEYPLYIEHLRRRRDFYQREDVTQIPIETMVKAYDTLARQNGFEVKWWFVRDRYFMYPLRRLSKKWRLCYLVLAFQKAAS